MQASSTPASQWWRFGGVFGIGFVILFIVGLVALQGETPSRDDSIEEVRQYFSDDGDIYLVGDFLGGLAFVFFFTPFAIILARMVRTDEPLAQIMSTLTIVGAVMTVVIGGIASTYWGALAISADNPEVDDSAVRTLMELDTYGFNAISFTSALFIASASLGIWRTGVLWRWLAGGGLLSAVLMIFGAAWPIDGDEEGAIAIVGFVGSIILALWILAASIGMLMRREEPAAA
jgi:hypothetical protein